MVRTRAISVPSSANAARFRESGAPNSALAAMALGICAAPRRTPMPATRSAMSSRPDLMADLSNAIIARAQVYPCGTRVGAEPHPLQQEAYGLPAVGAAR